MHKTLYLLADKLRLTHEALERDFQKGDDVWHFGSSPYEQNRFAKQIALVQSIPHQSILEIGCAEGHFTKQLTAIAKHVTAIDLSKTAVTRAKKRAPQATYSVADWQYFKPTQTYDVIIATEMLYYVANRGTAIQKMKQYGRYLITADTAAFAIASYPELKKQLILKHREFYIRWQELKMTTICLWEVPKH